MSRINVQIPIQFKCRIDCSNCCKSGGVVLINEDDIPKISKYLQLSTDDFLKRYTKTNGNKIYLIDRDINDCIFLDGHKCKIYSVRPIQCRTFPFWPQNLKSEKRWNMVMEECPGIGEGPEFSRQDIEEVFNGKPVNSQK